MKDGVSYLTIAHNQSCAFNLLPVDSKHFKAVDIEYTDDSGGSAWREIHSNSSVHPTHYQLEQPLVECLQESENLSPNL